MHTVNHRHPNLSSTLWLWPEFLPFTGEFLSSTRCHAVLECWTFSALLLSLSLPELFNCCCTESNHDSHLIGSYCLWLSITWLNYTLHSHAPALVVTRKTLAIRAAINQFISHSKIILPTLICMAVAAAAPRLVSLYFVYYNTSWGTALTSYPPIVIVHSESFPFDRELNYKWTTGGATLYTIPYWIRPLPPSHPLRPQMHIITVERGNNIIHLPVNQRHFR